jgi:hypothetical protein
MAPDSTSEGRVTLAVVKTEVQYARSEIQALRGEVQHITGDHEARLRHLENDTKVRVGIIQAVTALMALVGIVLGIVDKS